MALALGQRVVQEGCIVYGLFMDGARWCNDKQVIQDSLPKAATST